MRIQSTMDETSKANSVFSKALESSKELVDTIDVIEDNNISWFGRAEKRLGLAYQEIQQETKVSETDKKDLKTISDSLEDINDEIQQNVGNKATNKKTLTELLSKLNDISSKIEKIIENNKLIDDSESPLVKGLSDLNTSINIVTETLNNTKI